ncbi:MAG: hypothetical protein U0Q21_15760 [Dermatophilaceae bacterium]
MPHLAPAVLALSAAVAAGLTAAPAAAASSTPARDQCVATAGSTESACFATEAELASWKAARPGWRVLVLFFDGNNFRGAKKELGGYRNCTITTGDVDYANPAMPYGWNDRVSSFITMNGCDVLGYRHTYYGGGRFDRYTDRAANLGSWDDDISSFRLS